MNHFLVLLLRNLHAPCASQAHACVLCAKLLLCCCPRTWPARDPGAMQRQTNTFLTLHIALFTPHTAHFTLALHLNSSPLSSSHLNPCLPICQPSSSWQFSCQLLQYWVLMSTTKACTKHLLPSTTLYYNACTNYFPVPLCITKLAQTTSQYELLAQNRFQYYFVVQTVLLCTTKLAQKACTKLGKTTSPSTTCTNYFPILLCTTKLAQTTFPVLLCTTKLAQTTSYFVLLCTTTLAQIISQYHFVCTKLAQTTSQYYFALQSLHKTGSNTTL